MNEEVAESKNRLTIADKIEAVFKNLPKQKSPGLDSFTEVYKNT